LVFDQLHHKYYFNGVELDGATTWISKTFCVPFDENNGHIFKSQSKAKKNAANNVGITNATALRHIWNLDRERTSSLGTAVHTYAQMLHIYRQYGSDLLPEYGFEQSVYNAYNKITTIWDIVDIERAVYDLQYKIAGTIDLVLQHKKTKKYGIGDWKTFRDIDKTYNKMKGTLKEFPDSPRTKASVQLHLYDVIGNIKAENHYVINVKADGTFIVAGGKDNPLPAVRPGLMLALNTRLLKCNTIDNLI
ncbi:hypothetical protein MEN24_17860, partial [Dolichospermum sp. ST_sed10]|nr:hypothetical protein [Dolichospermum sp. ST_sed10]